MSDDHTPLGYSETAVIGKDLTMPNTTVPGYVENKDAYLKRLRRIEGQVRGLQR
ncbi:MAG: metal-sensing transcriptional repressor, partial [Candidatus Nanopelagicales bacterium]